MQILLPSILLSLAALILVILRVLRPAFRSAWLVAVGFAFLAWISVLVWQPQLPLSFVLPSWKPAEQLTFGMAFTADGVSWPFAISLVTLAIAALLTATAREDFPNPIGWANSMALCALGLLAVNANNPFTLIMIWAALDLAEVFMTLRASNRQSLSLRSAIAFGVSATGILLALFALDIGSATGKSFELISLPSQTGLLLIIAAGLRLGVLPVHLVYGPEFVMKRDAETVMRLVSAAASLVVLARIPIESLASPITPLLLVLALIGAIYGGWMWLRAPDELTGWQFWLVGLASLAVGAALRGNSAGATAWSAALILAGGALFLSSARHVWLNRILLAGAWSVSALPFSLTALGWINGTGGLDWTLPLFVVAQAFLMAGYIRHALRPATRTLLESQVAGAKSVYPAGIGLLLFVQLLLGVWGWPGALQFGVWFAGLAAALLAAGILWAVPRFPVLNPVPAQWQNPESITRLDQVYQSLWSIHSWLRRLSEMVSYVLEGDGGIMWTLVFLVLFITLIVQRHP